MRVRTTSLSDAPASTSARSMLRSACCACATSSAQAAATPEVTAAPTLASEQAVDSAIAAALEYYDAVSDADCLTNNPQNKQCVGLSSQPSTVQGGIAVFGVASPDGTGFVAVLGLDPVP